MAFPPEFGTNTGRQGIFDPADARQTQMALARLKELQTQYGDRLTYNYTGETGLASNDARGYSKWQNAITEADNINRIVGGRTPRTIRTEVQGLQAPSFSQEQVAEAHLPFNKFKSLYGR